MMVSVNFFSVSENNLSLDQIIFCLLFELKNYLCLYKYYMRLTAMWEIYLYAKKTRHFAIG